PDKNQRSAVSVGSGMRDLPQETHRPGNGSDDRHLSGDMDAEARSTCDNSLEPGRSPGRSRAWAHIRSTAADRRHVMAAADRHLLFGLLALQVGLIDQGQLVAAFQAWTRDRARTLAEHLAARGDLDDEQRSLLEGLVAQHLKKHGGDVEESLAAVPVGRSIRDGLADLGDPDIGATLGHLGVAHPPTRPDDDDPDRTASLSLAPPPSHGP